MSADLLAALGALADKMDRAGGGIYTADFKAGFRHAISVVAAHPPAEPEPFGCICAEAGICVDHCLACNRSGRDLEEGCIGLDSDNDDEPAHQSERTDTAEACCCGAPDTTSLNPAEVVVHRTDGPCYIAGAQPSEPERGAR